MSELLYEVTERIGHVTFNRPEVLNALTFGMYEGLAEICSSVPSDGSVKALIVSGAGDRAFAAGTDISQFRPFSTARDALDYEEKMDAVLRKVEQCVVPTIAVIIGACTGGGAVISAACDIRICDERLKFGFPVARTLGNCLSVANLNRLSALIGPGRLREILFTARLVEASEAASTGLVSEILETPQMARDRALSLAETLAGHAPLTLRATKEALRRLRVDGPRADGSDLVVGCYMSADFKEGVEAFLAKRKPNWQGR